MANVCNLFKNRLTLSTIIYKKSFLSLKDIYRIRQHYYKLADNYPSDVTKTELTEKTVMNILHVSILKQKMVSL